MSNVYPHAVRFSALVKSVATAGKSTEAIAPFELGVINPKTWTTVTDASTLKSFRVVVGSPNNPKNPASPVGFEDPFNRRTSFKSMELKGVVDDSFYTVSPREPKQFIGYYGYNGLNDCQSINLECGETVEFEVRMQGSIVERLYNQFEVFERFSVNTPCCPDAECTTGCDTAVDCGEAIARLVATMNDSRQGQNKVARFGKFSVVRSCETTPVVPTYTATIWNLSVSDTGDSYALDDVKAQYPGTGVERISRVGSISTYQFCKDGVVAPTDFVPKTYDLPADCFTCESGTFTPATDVWTVTANAATYANAAAVTTAYQNATVKTFTGVISAPNLTANQIPVTAHGFATGQRVQYTDGGGTAITGLVTATNYFVIKVDADTIKLATTLANAAAGTAIDITAAGVGVAHTLTASNYSTTLVSSSPTIEIYRLVVGLGNPVTAVGTDLVEFAYTSPAYCDAAAATPVAWVSSGTAFKVKRTLCLDLKNDDCDATNATTLAEIEAAYANDLSIVAGSITQTENGNCLSRFTMEQYNVNCLEDGCDTEGVLDAVYVDPNPFKGNKWGECACATPAEVPTDCLCGIKVVSHEIGCDFAGCGYDPTEYAEYDIPRFEIRRIGVYPGCDNDVNESWFVAQEPAVSTLDGHRVLQELLLYRQYRHEPFTSPSMEYAQKMIEVEGIRYGIDPCKKYYVLHLMGDYGEVTSLSSSFGDKLEDLQLFFEDRATLESTITLLSTYTLKPNINVSIKYQD